MKALTKLKEITEHPENYVSITTHLAHIQQTVNELEQQLERFCKDVLQLMAGIGWFNVEKERERAYTFIEDSFPELCNLKSLLQVRHMERE